MKILWIPHAPWHIPQRAHLFTRMLAERHEVHVTSWDGDFSRPKDLLSARYLRTFNYHRSNDRGITVHRIPRVSPALFSARVRRRNSRVFLDHVQRIIDVSQIDAVVGTFVVPPPAAPRLVFDLFDDNVSAWRVNRFTSAYADEIAATESLYLRRADVTVAASPALVQWATQQATGGPVHYIPNGIDLKAYERADGRVWRERIGVGGRLVGVVANFERQFEVALLLDAAALLASDSVVFYLAGRGSHLEWVRAEAARRGLTNVLVAGPVTLDELPSLVSAFDVGICPYEKTPMDEARSPMRLFSYLAAGIPVVCTDLASVRAVGLDNIVFAEPTPQAFAVALHTAIGLPRARPAGLEAYDLTQLTLQYERLLAGHSKS